MLQNIQNFLILNPSNIMSIVPLTMIFLIFAILLIKRKFFFNLFKDTNKTTWIVLGLIIACFFLLFDFGVGYFSPSDEEWEYLNIAKEMLDGTNVFPTRHGMLYPLLLSLSFKIFGLNPQVAGYLNLFLACFSIFLVFILSKIIFKKNIVSLISSLFYAFNFQIIYFSYFEMGFPTVTSFFILLATIFCILSFKYHNLSLHILSVTTLALMGQLKPELFILIIPYIICFLLFKEYKYLSFRKILLLFFLFLIFSVPFFVFHNQFKNSFNGWCGTPSQTFDNGKAYSYSLPFLDNIDTVFKKIVNGRFSLIYFVYDLPNLFRFWFSKSFALVMPFALLGIVLSFFKKKGKETLFILLTCSFLSFVYLSDCAYYEPRYVIPIFGILVVFSGYVFEFKKPIFKILPIFIIIILAFSLAKNVDCLKNNHVTTLTKEYYDLEEILSDVKKDSLIIIPHRNEIKMLDFMGYDNIKSITQMIKAPYFEKGAEFFDTFSLSIDEKKDNYFVFTWQCDTLPCIESFCNFIMKNYPLEKVKSREDYVLYKFQKVDKTEVNKL